MTGTKSDYYDTLVLRNIGYITPDVQEKIRNTRMLIAGCGIGSSFATLAARIGCTHFILADGDTVAAHNLNRQFYTKEDIGVLKVTALTRHLLEINPEITLEVIPENLTKNNIAQAVSRADFIFDTIDFLDLAAITELHDQSHSQKKPLVTAISVGFDGGLIYFPPEGTVTFRELFGIPATGGVEHLSYIEAFSMLLKRLAKDLDPQVIAAVSKALVIMEDGKPCPASQVAHGAFAVANLAGTAFYRICAGMPVMPAPHFIIPNVHRTLSSPGINLQER